MGECEVKNKVSEKVEKIEECGLSLIVCANINSPRKTDIYYNRDLQLARLLVTNVLLEYVKCGESVVKPVRCLDAIGGVGVTGLLWQKYISEGDISVTVNAPNLTSLKVINENALNNNLKFNVTNKDPCLLLHEEPFNFIHLDCHTEACYYLDAAFKNLPRNGIVAITTKDDAALQGRTPDIALRNYHGVITKTSYGNELAVRLVIAAMARSAAKYSKAIKVLCCAFFKNSFVIVVKSTKGSSRASEVLRKIRRLVHCNMCEERAFYPVTDGFILDNPKELLSCQCVSTYEGKLLMDLGPVWAGEIFDTAYIRAMMKHETLPNKKLLDDLLTQLLAEATCEPLKLAEESRGLDEEQNGSVCPPPNKKKKMSKYKYADGGENETPPFYYNLHRHSISKKGPHLVAVDKVIQALIRAGHRASRTHFDREAVRTDASQAQLVEIVQSCTK